MGQTNNPESPLRLGDFEIIREVGRGGMGVVYEARQVSLNRKVALKVLSAGLGLTPKAVQRFRREAEAAARLHHTNIVPVYATGEEQGTPYYAMELIDGPSLARLIRNLRQGAGAHDKGEGPAPATDPEQTGPYREGGGKAPELVAASSSGLGSDGRYFDAVARAVAEVADALEYAHGQGVVHRDVKPSNLLVGPDGRLSLTDFGLAQVLEQPGLTLSGEFVGTPRYMSPEQVGAGRAPVDRRTDVYSLGATLYELLALRPAFPGERREQVLAGVLHKEPVPPRRLNKKVPLDLETICLKALEKDPDRRYQTAGQLAEDLRRYVNRFAIRARRAGPIRRLAKWVRRRPAVAAALAAALVLALASGFFAYQAHVAQRQRQQQEQQLLAERRQNALEKALLVAMSGDLTGSEKAIHEAEVLGASAGQVCMLRGQVALHRGQSEEAIQHLEQAVALMPGSVAPRAMLATAYNNAGQYDAFEHMLGEVERLTCVTPEDYLFKAYMECGLDPVRGLADLDEAMRRRPSVIARSIRAEARTYRAMDTGDPADAELAVKDANAVREMMPDNPVALWRSMNAYLVAASAYEGAGQRTRQQAALAQAATDAQALARFPELPDAVWYRFIYFWYVDQLDSICQELRVAVETSDDLAFRYCYFLTLYRRGEFQKAVEVLERTRGTGYEETLRVLILMESPGGRVRALADLEQVRRRYQVGVIPIFSLFLLRLLGREAEAVEASRTHLLRPDRLPHLTRAFYRKVVEYSSGQLSEEQLLRFCTNSKHEQCRAHYFIAMTKLADGDRTAAREHFLKSIATRAFLLYAWDMSRALLARMDRDPKWPPWIPIKK